MNAAAPSSQTTPFFSVCIPVYNGEKFIRKAIESVMAQSFADWELVIVEDRGQDHTWKILQEYRKHPQIRIFQNERNLGQGANFNRLLELARGKWMTLLAADDSYVPHTLETIHSITANRPEIILWISGHLTTGHNVTPNVPNVFSAATEFQADKFAETLYLHGGIFGEISNFAFRLDRYNQSPTHRFPENTSHVDGDFWLRLMHANPKARVIYWPETLVHILIHEESASSADTRTGMHVVEIFNATEISISVGWSRAVQLRQIARMLWIGLKFFPVLPHDQKFRCLRTALLLWSDMLYRNEKSV